MGLIQKLLLGGKLKVRTLIHVLDEFDERITKLEEGSSDEEPKTPSKRDISISVTDGTNAIKGATVTIGSKTGTTGDAGGCTIKDVEEGSVSVEVAAEGFTTKTETITVDATHTSFTISLTAAETEPVKRDLSFTVNDGTNAIKGATVTIGSKTGTTGDAGGCTIKDVEEGTVSVEVAATGYTTKTESIVVDSTHTAFTISLVASSP